MEIRCVVACHNASGESDFFFVKVSCDERQYSHGEHYELAEYKAREEGYEGPMVVFDENDGPSFLFEHFVWESASVVS
jgi:hypothetical protein